MSDFHLSETPAEKTFLVGAQVRGSRPLFSLEDSLSELKKLAETAGMEVVGETTQMLHKIEPATFIGSGKIEEIKEELEFTDSKAIIFDDELSPRHQRELEKRFGADIKVLDRSALILDIFAQHAQTREGTLQVELAQYEYRLPRLTRQWTHLARQAGGSGSSGGVGLRGPGETQLEVDRREIGRKITKLKADLEQVRQHRGRHRAHRSRVGIPVIALVGYTNAGKSTMLRTLTDSDVYVADQLFATLDPTTRRINLPSSRQVLLTDTVGFIQKLPTSLIAAFRATLEEVTKADILLHVVDVSHPNVLEHIEAVEDTLAEIDALDIPKILVLNKIDRLSGEIAQIDKTIRDTVNNYSNQLQVTALKQQGIDDLLKAIEETLNQEHLSVQLLIPYNRGDLTSQLFEEATVELHEHTENGVLLTVQTTTYICGNVLKAIKSWSTIRCSSVLIDPNG